MVEIHCRKPALIIAGRVPDQMPQRCCTARFLCAPMLLTYDAFFVLRRYTVCSTPGERRSAAQVWGRG